MARHLSCWVRRNAILFSLSLFLIIAAVILVFWVREGQGYHVSVVNPTCEKSSANSSVDCSCCHTTKMGMTSPLIKSTVNGKQVVGSYFDANGYIYVMARAPHDGAPPVIYSLRATPTSYTSVNITWYTTENANTSLDWGLTTAYGSNVSDGNYITSHSIPLTGLTNHTTYHYRITTADVLGNTLVSGDYTFSFELPPIPTGLYHQSSWAGDSNPLLVTLRWSPVTDPVGGAVEYQAVLSTDPNFGTLNYDSGWISTTSSVWSTPIPTGGYNYYWKVRARNVASPTTISNWSAVDHFYSPKLISGPTVTITSYNSATITWTTDLFSTSSVNYGLTDAYGSTANGSYTYSHTVNLTGLINHNTYHYRIISSTGTGSPASDTLITGDLTFALDVPPPVPTLIHQSSVSPGVSPYTVNLNWNAVTDPDGGPVQYEVVVSNDPNFGALTYDSGWISGTSQSLDLTWGYTYYWKVRTSDAAHPTAVSNWSAVDSFNIYTAPPPLAPTLLSPASPGWWELDYTPSTVSFSWNPVTAPDTDSCQYYVQVSQASNFSSIYAYSGWITDTTWTLNNVDTGATYYWRVMARDSVHTDAQSGWSTPWQFTIAWWVKSSCPLIYVWTGKEYKYQTDSEIGTIGQSPKTDISKYVGLYKESYIKMDMIKPDSQGNYKIKLREGQKEADYLDQLKLLVVDHPADTSVYDATAMNTYNFGYRTAPKIYTVRNARVPRKAWYKDGSDITALVSKVDNKPAPAVHGEIDSYIFDFGPVRNTANAKLLIDGWTVFGLKNPAITGSDQAPYIELVNAQGNWQKVKSIGFPAGDLKTIVVDLSRLFLSQDHRIKLCTGIQKTYKFVFDRVSLDESVPVTVKTQYLTATSADLHYRGRPGFRYTNLQSRLRAQDNVLPDLPEAYMYGAFTRYGDVRELINQTDDKFAIMRHGDELTLTFPAPITPVPRGYQRSIFLMTDLFFKVMNKDYQPANWDQITPWPYHGMASYPPSTDKYANDPGYQAYLQNYNTRVYTKTASLAEKYIAAALPEVSSADGILPALEGAWKKGREYLQKTLLYMAAVNGGLEKSPAATTADFMLPSHRLDTEYAAGEAKVDRQGQENLPPVLPGNRLAGKGWQGKLTAVAQADSTPAHYSLNTDYVGINVFNKSGASFIYNITNPGAEAWQSASLPNLTVPGTLSTADQKAAIATIDGNRWITSLVSADRAYDYQMYRFQITQPLTTALKWVDVTWVGHGDPTAGYNVELYLWNFSTNNWEGIGSFLASSDVSYTVRNTLSIDGMGRSAEALCTSCHQTNYHQWCLQCHGSDPIPPMTFCYYCHGHNSIQNFVWPDTSWNMVNGDCTHCHDGWLPWDSNSVHDFTPPSLTSGPTVSNLTAAGVTITWTTNEASTSYVNYGTDLNYGGKTGSNSLVTTHSVTLTGLNGGTTYHYRLKSADWVLNEMITGDFTFTTLGADPPSIPVLIHQPNILYYDSTYNLTLQWNPSTSTNNHPVEYYVMIDDMSDFSSPNYVSGWISGTSWTVSVAAPAAYYWRVQARDALYPAMASNWSTADYFIIMNASPPPAPTLVHNQGGSINAYTFTLGVDPPAQPLQWSSVSAPDGDPVQYYVQLSLNSNFGSIYTNSGWTSATSWTLPVAAGQTYYWRAMARDAVHTTAMSAWSAVDSFYIECTIPPKSSCPFIYTWDGEKYQYITDIQGEALGIPKTNPINKYVYLYGPDYIVLDGLQPDGDNLYRVKIREILAESDYFDEAKLLLADYPAGYEIVSSSAENTYHMGYVNPFKIYTLKDPRPPLSAVDQNGNDILDKVLAVDNNPAPPDIQAPEYYTFDFGPIAHPENAKLVLDGWSIYGADIYKVLPSIAGEIYPYVELIDARGQWQKVRTFGFLSGDLKTMVVDLSGLFMSSDHRIRLNLGYSKSVRTIIDRVRLDDSAPVEVTVTEVPASSADLHHGGMATADFANLEHRSMALDDSQPDLPKWYMYGAFTRYGDVLPLLSDDDDKTVLMRHGDELSFTFPNVSSPPYGMERKVLLKADVYYKSNKLSVMVDPLPYNGMTAYPPDPWLGPTSADYLQYLQDYNTRIYQQPSP